MRPFLPFLELRRPSRASLGRDLLAALVVTFTAVPQCVAYALIAGLPPAAGLYAAILPTIVGSLFRSSRHVVAGPSNAVSLLVGGAVAVLAPQLGASPVETALALALLVGLFQVGAGLLQLGAVVDYISAPVVLGYITGAGVLIGVGQLGHLTGTPGGSGVLPAQVMGWVSGLGGLRPVAVGLGGATIAAIVALRRWRPRLPAALIGLVGVTAASLLIGTGVERVGDLAPVPSGLPPLALPTLPLETLLDPRLAAAALAVTVLSLVESSAVARSIADRTGDRLDLSVEFWGQGLANLAAAFSGGYPISGSLSRSALNHASGASTRLAGVAAGVLTAVLVLVAGPLVDQVPIAALAGLLMVVAVDLVRLPQIRQALRATRSDALAFVATVVGTWTLRLDHAIYLGVVLSIALFLRRARMLVVRELVVAPDGRLREASGDDGREGARVRVLHVEGPLFFGAAGELREALSTYTTDTRLKALVVRLKRTQGMDLTSAKVILAMVAQLRERSVEVFLVGLRSEAHRLLQRVDIDDVLGPDHVFPTQPGWFHAMDAAVEAALEVADAPDDSPLRRYLETRSDDPPPATSPGDS